MFKHEYLIITHKSNKMPLAHAVIYYPEHRLLEAMPDRMNWVEKKDKSKRGQNE